MTSEAVETEPEANGWGWYLYGIVRRSDDGAMPESDSAAVEGVQRVDFGDLTAIVRPVPLSQFDEEAIRRRADDPAWLHAIVQSHNEIIAAVHEQRAILPAKFGSIYAQREDVATALAENADVLLRRLQQLEGMDEWAVHVQADRQLIEERIVQHEGVQRLRGEIAAASPGRRYFLERQIERERTRAADDVAGELARLAYDDLGRYAADAQIGPPNAETNDEIEVLKAAFLVSRSDADAFITAIETMGERYSRLHATYSGPWPPYSFATLSGEDLA